MNDDVVTATLKNVEAKREVMSRGGGSYIEINDPGFGTLSKVGKYEVEVKTSNMIATYSVAAITFIVSRRISGDVCVQGGLTIASIILSNAVANKTNLLVFKITKYEHDSLFKTYCYTENAYLRYQGIDHYAGQEIVWNQWAGL